jgi:plasmid stability protein
MRAPVKAVSDDGGVATLYVRNLDDELHRRIRVAAALRGQTIQALVVEAVEQFVTKVEADERKR